MSHLVGNLQDRFSRDVALIGHSHTMRNLFFAYYENKDVAQLCSNRHVDLCLVSFRERTGLYVSNVVGMREGNFARDATHISKCARLFQ